MRTKNPDNSDRFQYRMFSILSSINNAVACIEKFLLIIILSTMIGVSVLQIILRNFFHTGLFTGELVTRHLVLWVCFVGASLTTYYRHHIKIDVINRLVSAKTNRWLSFAANLVSAVVCVYLGKAGYTFLVDEIHYGGYLADGLPRWIFTVVIPGWFYIMAVRFGLRLYEDLLTGNKT